jgi:hypothetical protein
MSDEITINIDETIDEVSLNIEETIENVTINIDETIDEVSLNIEETVEDISLNIEDTIENVSISVDEGVTYWGEIYGDILTQTDLIELFDTKSDVTHNHNLNDLSEKSYNSLTDKPTIPDELSDLADDSTHRLVTDTEKSTWNGKQDSLGYTPVPNTRTINGYELTNNISLEKNDIGLSNCDNTSDLNKPISTATQNALDNKENNLGFTPENISNKLASFQEIPDDTHYATEKLIKDNLDTKSDVTHNHNLNDLSEKSYNSLTDKPTIPDELSDLADDSTHRLVTDTEKSTWNGKQDSIIDWSTPIDYYIGNIVKRINTLYLCVSNHTSSTFYIDWLTNGYWIAISDNPGKIIMTGKSTADPGYLLCDGKTIGDSSSGADYAGDNYRELYEYIKDNFGGAYNWSNYDVVLLPDFRGIFPRGAGTHGTLTKADGNYFTGTFGQYNNDMLQKFWLYVKQETGGSVGGYPGFKSGSGTGSKANRYIPSNSAVLDNVSSNFVAEEFVSDGVNGDPRVGDETNPANICVNFQIKY